MAKGEAMITTGEITKEQAAGIFAAYSDSQGGKAPGAEEKRAALKATECPKRRCYTWWWVAAIAVVAVYAGSREK